MSRHAAESPAYSVALGAGLREHEILALNLGDVFDEAGHARRRVRLRVFKRASEDPAPSGRLVTEGRLTRRVPAQRTELLQLQ